MWLESPPKGVEKGVHVDISLQDKSEASDPRTLIEVKRYDQRGTCNKDAERLKALSRKYPSITSALIVAYLYMQTTEKVRRMTEELQQDLATFQTAPERKLVEFFKDGLCAIIVAELL